MRLRFLTKHLSGPRSPAEASIMRLRSRTAGVALAAFTALGAIAPSVARADDTDPNSIRADALFNEGRDLAAAGDFAAACPKFAESQKLRPGIGTLFNLADCHEKQGDLPNAYQEFNEVVERTKQALQTDRQEIAQKRVDALKAKLGQLVIQLPPTQLRINVTLDGTPLNSDRIGVTLLLPAGQHHVVASSLQNVTPFFDQNVQLAGNLQTQTVIINAAPGPKMENNTGMVVAGSILIGLGGIGLLGAALVAGSSSDSGAAAGALGLTGIVCLGVGIPILVVGLKKHPVATVGITVDGPRAMPEIAVQGAAPIVGGLPRPQAGLTATWNF